MQERIKQIQQEYLEKVGCAESLARLDELFLELFGKNGVVTELPKAFSGLSKDELKEVGPAFNQAKQSLEEAIGFQRSAIREESYKNLDKETLDLETKAEVKKRQGHLHPITEFEDKIVELFNELGFQQFDGPEIDTDENNFGLLNIPPEHPARDMWDTLYLEVRGERLEDRREKLLLRTHTSNAQMHIMKQFKPPIRAIIIGRCFRYENLDARHEHTFDQFEIVYVDKGVSMANLQYLSEYFLKGMLGKDVKARLSPGYYPFTEPSAHIFGTCVFCNGKGCKICGGTGELELAGAGMIHPNVLRNCGIDPEVYSGIAWGAGPGRMAMLKYDIKDVRLFNSGDLEFLQRF